MLCQKNGLRQIAYLTVKMKLTTKMLLPASSLQRTDEAGWMLSSGQELIELSEAIQGIGASKLTRHSQEEPAR